MPRSEALTGWEELTMGPSPVAQPGSACSSRLHKTSSKLSWVCMHAMSGGPWLLQQMSVR